MSEGFETGLPSTASAVESVVSLSSGSWRLNGVTGGSDNGSIRMRMATNAYAITPAIDKPVNVSFDHRGSGSGKVVTLSKSVDGGLSWTVIGTATVNSSSTYGRGSFAVNEAGTPDVLLRFQCNSATIFVDNVTVTISGLPDEPGRQASLEASDINGSSVAFAFIKGNGNGRLLMYSPDSTTQWSPTDGTVYLNLPKEVDSNVLVVYSGNDDGVVVDGLSAGQHYFFKVFEYSILGNSPNYLTTPPGKLTVKTAEVPTLTVHPTAIHFGAVKTGASSIRTITLSGKYLNESDNSTITLESSPEFHLSIQPDAGFAPRLTLPYTGTSLAETVIYIQFSPVTLLSYQHTLTLGGGGAFASVDLKGTGSNSDAKVYYISPAGNDSGDGSFNSPWYNLQKAVNVMVPGDTVICRGGVYYPGMKQDGSKTTVRLSTSGSAEKKLTIKNYPGEFPVFNFRDQPKKVSIRGIQLNGNYWHINGLHITEAGDNGLKIEGSYNRIERCTFSYNDDTGLQLGFGHNFSDSGFGSSNDGSYCAYNDIVDCDSYLNCDADNFGSDADGFACKMHNGKGNRFIRCRAWDNADDGWDMYETDYAVYLIECWTWGSGRASNFGWVQSSGSFQGNGNGIKLGGNGTGGSSKGIHEAWNCVAFNNNKTGSVKGFDQNSHSGGEKIINCLAFGNGYDFMFENSNANRWYYNNVCFGNIEIGAGSTESHNAMLSNSSKAWSTSVIRGFSTADYQSLTEEDAKAPRGADGSMPRRFARLRQGSVLIDKGLNVSLPFVDTFPFLAQPVAGAARDLGPYEFVDNSTTSSSQLILNKEATLNFRILPAENNSDYFAQFGTNLTGKAKISMYSLNGQRISDVISLEVEAGGEYYIPFNTGNLPAGTYLCILQLSNSKQQVQKIIIHH